MNDLLPPNATTQERAISLAVGSAVPVPNRQLWSPWTCPIEVLPWLAWALSVDDWSPLASDDQKRAIIADSIDQHRRKGTPAAVRRALQPLGYDIEIDERTGTVYRFALQFKLTSGTAGGAVLEDAVNKAQQIALRTKNARSELGSSRYLAEAPDTGGPVIAAVTISGSETAITDAVLVPPGIIVTGDLVDFNEDPITFPFLFLTETPGFWRFPASGEIADGLECMLTYMPEGPTYWSLTYDDTVNAVYLYWTSEDNVADPTLITSWDTSETYGMPIITNIIP